MCNCKKRARANGKQALTAAAQRSAERKAKTTATLGGRFVPKRAS